MTIQITYGDLRNRSFLRVIGKLGSYPFKDQKFSFSVMRICKKIESEIKLADEQFRKTLKEYALLDEKGDFVPDQENGKPVPDSYQIPAEKQEAWQKVYDDFCALPVVIEQPRIALDKLEELKMAPAELGTIETMLEEPGADEAPTAPPNGPKAPIPMRR